MKFIMLITFVMISGFHSYAQEDFQTDVYETENGELEIHFIGHGTLMFEWNDLVIHVDPTSREADYTKLPDADIVLITHHHGDHLDLSALQSIYKSGTEIILTQTAKEMMESTDMKLKVMKNNDHAQIRGIGIDAIPAYNIIHKRDNGELYHPLGIGNGYVLEMGGKRVLIGGDTENIPEIKELKKIDIAFLPMNLPYTMTPEMVADAAKAFKPDVLYPYHYGNTDTDKLVELMKDEDEIEVRIRELQ